jgi:hypothetical protein
MAKQTISKEGEICWRELTTQNSEKAKTFYSELFDWNYKQSENTPMQYDEISANGESIGGVLQINDQWGEGWDKIPSHWMTYIAVDNCDTTIEKIKEHGGSVCVEPFDIPNVGRISVINDPSGANFSVIQLFVA